MFGPRAVGSALAAGAPRRPRHGYFRARILLDAGFAVFAVSAFVAFGINGKAGFPSALEAPASPDRPVLTAPVERGAGQPEAVADRAVVIPSVAPIPAPPPTAALVAGAASLVGLAGVLAGLVVAGMTARRRRYEAARSPSTTKSSSRPV